jgi:hypothetical protein
MNPHELQAELNNWIVLASMALSAVVHGYQLVANSGGVRGIVRRFINGNETPKKEP